MQWITNEFSDGPIVTTTQRWGNYLTIAWGVVSLVVVANIRGNILAERSIYTNNEAGIVAPYPSEWLLDEDSESYVFRIRDIQQLGFKTTFQVALRPISGDTTPRTLIDTLAMQRAQTLAAYRILGTEPLALEQDVTAQQVTYTYVDTQVDPFLEQLPTVVIGIDVVTISRGQAVIITMLSDREQFAISQERFFEFVDQMEF